MRSIETKASRCVALICGPVPLSGTNGVADAPGPGDALNNTATKRPAQAQHTRMGTHHAQASSLHQDPRNAHAKQYTRSRSVVQHTGTHQKKPWGTPFGAWLP